MYENQNQSSQVEQCQHKSSDRWMSDQQKRQFSHRFTALLRRFNNQNPQFSAAVRNLLYAIEDVKNEGKQLAEQVTDSAQEPLTESYDAKKAKKEAKKIVEEFSGRKIDKLLHSIKRFAKKLNEDKDLNKWMDDFHHMVEDCIDNPQIVDNEQFYERLDDLIDRASQLLQDIKEREHYQYILDETKAIFESIKNDPDVKNLQNKIDTFVQNFMYTDEKGNRQFNGDLAGQMRKFIAPLLLKQLEHIPVPSFEGSNEDMDFKIDNLVLNGSEIIPDHVHIAIASNMDFNVKELETEKAHSKALLKVTNIKTKVENMKFWFKRKSIPKIEDHGIADVSLTGDGANLSIYLELSAPFDEQRNFKFSRISFDIDKLQIDIKETQHTIVMPILMAVLQGKFKRDIEQAIEDKIKSVCGDIETGLNELMQKYPPTKLANIMSEQITGKTDIFETKDPNKMMTNEPALLSSSEITSSSKH